MQKVLNLTNKYIVLATPLILYSLISSVYLVVSAGGKLINLIFALILFFLMTGAFIAGWFKMVKLAVVETEDVEPFSLLKNFPEGVGEFFLPSLGALIVVFMLSILMLIASYFIGLNFIGNPDVSADALSKAMQNPIALKSFILSLNPEQLIKINLWNMLILGTMTLTYFLVFLYLPAIFFKNKNPFIAFFISLKDLFSRKFFKTLMIFLLIFFINFILSVISTIASSNSFIHFIMTLVNFYFITAVGVGIFYYYYVSFIKNQLGNSVDIKI